MGMQIREEVGALAITQILFVPMAVAICEIEEQIW
jgi:hypothetical protein